MVKTLIIISSLSIESKFTENFLIESNYYKYAKHIPYEELYQQEDYFVPYSMEELIIYQNKKLLKTIFDKELEKEIGY